MSGEKMNQFLRERKIKLAKQAKLRKNRIVKNFHKNVQGLPVKPLPVDDPKVERSLKFYEEVFKGGEEPSRENQHKQVQGQCVEPFIDQKADRIAALKLRQKKFIKKMSYEKTRKGQPVMRNYIKYALNKLEQTLEKEKAQKAQLAMETKNKSQSIRK